MKALILIDLQNDYFEGGAMELAHAEKASEKAQQLLQQFRKESLPIVHIQHIATRPEAGFFLPGTSGAEIHRNVQPGANEKIIVKHSPNSFQGTELLTYLQESRITDLVICGMMTHMCVDSTTRAAKDFGFACTVIADACATKSLKIQGQLIQAQDVHNSFLAALNYYYATVKTTKEYVADK
ncbi:cysteine hydrolase family protein [Rapidithrix thailandica]|uniref:Cysteine hydrolase family protein n=1 Tax=Rapidithrix thailandica TaxID=413964 RepID=A0AAW9SA31_9BACT